VIYTTGALDTLRYSDNDQAYWDQMGGDPPSWSDLAACALQADVQKQLGFEPSNIHEVDCPRCGTVVSTENERDETDCPKCGLDLSTEEREGFDAEGSETKRQVCADCLTNEERECDTTKAIEKTTVFDCDACGETFITPDEDSEASP
jgi:predicted RNA-binding Zn-ribbon protein involved in translation (DUF1610 family)